MAELTDCVLLKAEKRDGPCCGKCEINEKRVDRCALADVTEEEAKELVVPPIGGPKFSAILARLLQHNFQNAADDLAALIALCQKSQ
jgi:hypothetical protein